MERPRFCVGHEDANTRSLVRNDTSVPVEPLSRAARRSSTASPSSRNPIASGANTGTATIRVDGNPQNPPATINAFMSPTQILAPRVFRFNVSYEFGRSSGFGRNNVPERQ